MRDPRVSGRQRLHGIRSRGRISGKRTRRTEPTAIRAYPEFPGIRIVSEPENVSSDLRVRGVNGLDVHRAGIGKRKVVLVSGLSVIVYVDSAGFFRSRSTDFRTRNSEYVHGHGGCGRIGKDFPIPFPAFRKRLRRPSELMGSRVGRRFEVT